MACCFCNTLFERLTCRSHRRRRRPLQRQNDATNKHFTVTDNKLTVLKRMAPKVPEIQLESEQEKPNYSPFPDWPTWDDKPETERYILQKPVASVSPFPTQMSQSEDAEHAVALYDFEAQHEDELSFNAGDQLLVTSRCDNDWLYGCTVKDSRFGIFPVSFVLIGSESGSETESLKEVEEAGDCELQNRVAQEGKQIGPINGSSNGRPVIAIFAFSPEQEGDLSLQEGESITVLSRINKDWLMGRNSKGETGQFPATFVQLSDSMDSNSTKASAESEVYICVFDFEAQQTDDLTIRVGDKIRVTEKVSEEWWQGHVLGEKAEGIFPSTFVEPM